MKILYCGLLYNYGKPEEGFSYEHFNLEAGFRDCAIRGMFDVDYWHPDQPEGDLLGALSEYDAIFHVAFNDSLDLPESIAKLALKQDIPVIQWDCDSSWRFDNWILPRKDRVSHFITTHSATIPWYKKHGMNVIRSQWAGSPLYEKNDLDKIYDVSMFGQKHGRAPDGTFFRATIVNHLLSHNIDVHIWGNYWEGYDCWHGYEIDYNKMIHALNSSKIGLNLSNPWHHGSMPQLKGRVWELAALGCFQITTPADDLESYYTPDKEIIVVNNSVELVDRIKYYLNHEEEREIIAKAMYDRTQKEHLWKHRFEEIFKEIGI